MDTIHVQEVDTKIIEILDLTATYVLSNIVLLILQQHSEYTYINVGNSTSL